MPYALDDPRLEPRTIAPLPAAAADLPPAAAAVDVDPPAGRGPDIWVAGAPFKVRARALAPPGCPNFSGAIRWRPALAPRWREEVLQKVGDNTFEGSWTPPEAGDYEWAVELWTGGQDDALRPGSSGADELHLLRAECADLAAASWYRAGRAPLNQLASRLGEAADSGCGAVLLPVIFAVAPRGQTVGRGELGHYSIDPELGDTHDFGRLAQTAGELGLTLALNLPLRCAEGHPFRRRDPDVFSEDGTPELIGEGWRERWEQWEAVFRFWAVQGIGVFHIPDAERVPVAFWEHLIESLRDDFPELAFSWSPDEARELRPYLARAGFTVFDIPSAPPPDPEPEAEVGVECFCTNPAIRATLLTTEGGGHRLQIENLEPDAPQRGHIHLDAAPLGLGEGERYTLRDPDGGHSPRWTGTANYIALDAGEPARTFRIERE